MLVSIADIHLVEPESFAELRLIPALMQVFLVVVSDVLFAWQEPYELERAGYGEYLVQSDV